MDMIAEYKTVKLLRYDIRYWNTWDVHEIPTTSVLFDTCRLKAGHVQITYKAQLLDARNPEHGWNAERDVANRIQTVDQGRRAAGRHVVDSSRLEERLELVVDWRLGVVLVHHDSKVGAPIKAVVGVGYDDLDRRVLFRENVGDEIRQSMVACDLMHGNVRKVVLEYNDIDAEQRVDELVNPFIVVKEREVDG